MARLHCVYGAVIAVLILVVVFASAKAVRAARIMAEVKARFGLNEAVRSSLPRKGGEGLRQCKAADLLRPRTFDQYRREVDALLERAQTLEEFGTNARLSEACSKALVGGKRFRATILLEVARATSVRRLACRDTAQGDAPTPVDAGEAALFIEYIHSASLVIDDLPAFDNDLLRRGRPSLHAEVGPAVAQMAALSLITAAFQNVCRQLDWIRDNCSEVKNVDRIGTRICSLTSRALGAFGASGGQLLEMTPEDWPAEKNLPERVAVLKTASLFELAVGVGWLVAGGDPGNLEQMITIGRHLGVAFQIADDLGDMVEDASRAPGSAPSVNYANLYGQDVAVLDLERQLRGARLLLSREMLWTPLWENEIYPAFRARCGPLVEAPAAAAASSEPPAAASELPAVAAPPEPPAERRLDSSV